MKIFKTIFVFGAMLAIGAVPSFADVYGTNPLADPPAGGINDYCTGCLFAYVQAPASANGHILSSWAFDTVTTVDNHDVTGGNGMVTPLLFNSAFTLVGIGTTQQVMTGKQYSFSFGLSQGSALVQTGDYFGWVDGNGAADGGDNGIIALTALSGGPGVDAFTCGNTGTNGAAGSCFNSGGASLGQNYAVGMTLVPGREYQVNFTTPEPGTVLLFLIFGSIVAVCARVAREKVVP